MSAIALIALFPVAATHTPALAVRPQVDAGMEHTVVLNQMAVDNNNHGQCHVR